MNLILNEWAFNRVRKRLEGIKTFFKWSGRVVKFAFCNNKLKAKKIREPKHSCFGHIA